MAKNVTLKRVNNTSGATDDLHPTTDWSQIESKPSTFTPTSHTHTLSDITDAGTVAAINLNSSTTQFLRGDGTFASVDSGNQYVNISGDTMTGTLQVGLTGADYKTQLQTNALQFDRDGTSYIQNVGTGNLAFRFGSSYNIRALLTNDGKLGIGTTSPAQKLDVAGTAHIGKIDIGAGTFQNRINANGDQALVINSNGSVLSLNADVSDNLILVNGGGNVGIGDTTPSYKLEVAGDMAVNKIFDRNNGSYYLDPASTSVVNALNVQALEVEGAIFNRETDQLRMPFPKGGFYTNGSSSVTGAIEITLPSGAGGNYSMISFFVDVYDYAGGADGESFTLHLGGYVNGSTWTNTFANMVAVGRTDRFFNVRYNVDGNANKIYIAETTNNWAYPKIQIRDFMAGHSGADDSDWYNNPFTIDITTTIDGTTARQKTLESVATWADQVDVNSSSSTSYYNVIWHSGDTIYYAANNKLRVQPSTGNLQIDGNDVATQNYVDLEIAQLVDSAPGALDTLNELAAALGDDASFSTTITNSIAGKVSKTGDTMTGNLTIDSASFASLTLDRESTTSSSIVQFTNNGGVVGGIGGFGNDGLQFRTTDGTKMVLDSNNRVGIGTESPLSTLDVRSDDGIYITTATNAPTNGAQIRFSDHSSQAQYGFIKYKHANQTVSTEPVNSDDGFIIGGSETNTVVSIEGSLNVEGQSNFEGQLEVDSGDLIVRSGNISGSNFRAVLRDNSLENQSTNGNSDIGINYYGYAGGTTQFRDLNVYDGKTNLIAQFEGSTGRVGIGTNAPSAKLHIIETTSGADIAKFRNNTDTADVTIKTSGEVGFVKAGAGDQLQLSANGTDNNGIRIKTDGYVGIGATNPSAKLDVEGAGIFNSDGGQRVLYLRQSSSGFGNIVQFQGASNQNVWELVGRDSHFYIYNNDLSKYAMYIEDSNNRIGINGHNTPSVELDVNGQIRAFSSNSAKIWSENTGSGQASLELKNTEGHFRFITDNGGYSIYDQIDAAERFAIDTNGNSTIRGNLTVTSAYPRIFLTDTDSDSDYSIINGNGTFSIYDDTNGVMRMQINSSGDTTFSSGAVVATDYMYAHANLLTKGNLYLNYDNNPAGADAYVYFGDDASDTAHWMRFDNSAQQFGFSNRVVGTAGRLGAIESNGSDVDKVNFQLSGTTLTITTS